MRQILALWLLLGLFSVVPTGAAEEWEILFAPRVTRTDAGLSYRYRIRSLGSNRGEVDLIRIRNVGRAANLLTPEVWEDPGEYSSSWEDEGNEPSSTPSLIGWTPYRAFPFPYSTRTVREEELRGGNISNLPLVVQDRIREMNELPEEEVPLLNSISPGGTSPEFGILDSADLPGIITWEVLSTFPRDSEVKDAGQTVAPEFVPDDLSIPQRIFRMENLIQQAGELRWLGHETVENLLSRARAARRKTMMAGETSEHSEAAWAKMIQLRDDLKDAFKVWTDRRPYDSTGLPDYDRFVVGEHEADDRAWYLLEPNARDLLDRLSPPHPPGRGRGPTRR